jgi:hypothetical protein
VDHTFEPSGTNGSSGVYEFVNREFDTPLAFERVTVEVRDPIPAKPGQASQGRTYKVRITLRTPVLEVAGDSSSSGLLPAPTLAYTPMMSIEFLISERTPKTVIENLSEMGANLLANSTVREAIDKLERIYG